MAAIKIAIVGVSGRMGQEIASLIAADSRFQLSSGVARDAAKATVDVVAKPSDLPAAKVDVVIDFSQPELFGEVLEWCMKNRKPLVSGVTGIDDKNKTSLAAFAKVIPVLWAPNMSLGVAVVAEMFKALKSLKGFDFQIEEAHHNRKKDKPSGTALFLQEKLVEALGRDVPEPLAMRGGGIFGIHKTWAMGEEEIITIEHTAMNRKVFARGALEAAHWISSRAPGLYKMADVLQP